MTIQAQILALLDSLQAEMGMALLFITHDLNLVRRFTHRVGVMERGRLVETGPTAQVFAAPAHPYTQTLLASRPRRRVQPLDPAAPIVLQGKDMRVSFAIREAGFAIGSSPATAATPRSARQTLASSAKKSRSADDVGMAPQHRIRSPPVKWR